MRLIISALLIMVLAACNKNPTSITSPTPIPPIRVMCLGDSITYGVGWDGGETQDAQGYRGDLSSLLGSSYVFVGSQINGNFSQNHHEGHPGYPISGQPSANGWRPGIYENIQNWMEANPADIILLHIGSNDIAINPTDTEVYTEMLINLGYLLQYMHEINGSARIYVAEITEIDVTKPANGYDISNVYNQIQAYNSGIPKVVQGMDWVTVVAMPILDSTDMWDLFHPNATGYKKMAQTWYNSITANM